MATRKRPVSGASTNSKNMPGKRKKRAVRRAYSNQKLKRALVARYGEISVRKWARAISADERVTLTFGTLQRALMGIEPKRPELRLALGLPALVATPVCRDCGIVHVSKRCPTRRKATAAPRRDWKGIAKLLWAAYLGYSKREMTR